MKAVLSLLLFLGIPTTALAGMIDGRWYFTESQCISVTGDVRQQSFAADESIVMDFAGEGGMGTATVHNAQGLCKIDFSLKTSVHAASESDPTQRIIIERQVRGDSPQGCSEHMTSDQSAYEFTFKHQDTVLELRENRAGSQECRTRVNYLSRYPICGR